MRTFLAIVASIALGLGASVLTLMVNVSWMEERFFVEKRSTSDSDDAKKVAKDDVKEGSPEKGTAKLEVINGDVYDFGSMEKKESLSHTFLLKNTGTAPLSMSLMQTSCKCTFSEDMGVKKKLVPGAETEVTLTWEPKSYEREFEQTATIEIYDAANRTLVLRVKGVVIQMVRPEPNELVLSSVPQKEETKHLVRVYAYKRDDLQVVDYKWRDDQKKDLFEVEMRPLTEGELASERGALSGSLITVTTKPGLPFGRIDQELDLKTNLEDEDQWVNIPVIVNVESDVNIQSFDPRYPFHPQTSRLDIGTVSKGKPVETQLSLFVKGVAGEIDNITMKVLENETIPKNGITAEFGEVRSIRGAKSIPVTIKIPDDQPAVSLEGSDVKSIGRIVIETNIESARRIEIFVSYTVSR